MKLHAKPEATAVAIVNFPDCSSAVDCVVTILKYSLPMARIELLDEVSVKACNAYSNLSLVEKPVSHFFYQSTKKY